MVIRSGRGKNRRLISSQKIGFALAGSSVLFCHGALALSIGNPQLGSYLAQPLQVLVPVSDLETGKNSSDYKIRALPASEYEALGLPLPDFKLENLRLSWANFERKQAQILIISQRAVTEPVVTVLLEIRGHNQRWVRQLNLLLDPAPVGVQATAASTNEASLISPKVNFAPAPSSLGSHTQYGPVRSGEVLSVIAQNVRMDREIPLTQMAQAIVNINKHAFPNGPRSLLVGVMLNIPTPQQIAAASRNAALMVPSDDSQPQSATAQHVGNKGGGEEKPRQQAFLPKSKYLEGYFFPLSMQFLSYEDVRPVNLQPTLQALEAAEPIRFRADWTLSTPFKSELTQSVALSNVEVAPTIASNDVASVTRVEESELQPNSISDVQQDAKTEPAFEEISQASVAEDRNRAQYYRPTDEQTTDALSGPNKNATNAGPTVLLEASKTASSKSATSPGASVPQGGSSAVWWWLLLLVPGVAVIAWVQRRHWLPDAIKPAGSQQLPSESKETVSDDRSGNAQPSVRSPEGDIVRQAFKRRLKSSLESSDSDIVRRAKVALALFDRGRIEDAEQRIDELVSHMDELAAQAEVGETENTMSQESVPVKKSMKSRASVDNSELEQRRVLKAARKLLSANLSTESERQVKVATALSERGNVDRAREILEKVKKELQQREAEALSAAGPG